MKTQFFLEPFEHFVLSDVYDEKQYEDIKSELKWIVESNSHFPATDVSKSGAAFDKETKQVFTNKRCVFLDPIYGFEYRSMSRILTHNRKILDLNEWDEQSLEDSDEGVIFKNYLPKIMSDTTLVNFYQGGEEYKSHNDNSVFTGLWFHWENRENFKGGELYFKDYDFTFKCENNTAIIFPGPINHEVKKLLQIEEEIAKCDGRYSITQFFNLSS